MNQSDVNSGLITRLLNNRKTFLEILIAAILLSLSINLISGSILEIKWIPPLAAFLVAVGLAIICMIYFMQRLLLPHTQTYHFNGFFIYDSKKNWVMGIPRYHYGNHLRMYLGAAFAENEVIKKLWDKEPISTGLHFDKETGEISRSIGKGHQLIVEATEYYILHNLCIHLTDYFSPPNFSKGELRTIARDDIPDVLLANRFLELFSKPREDRPLFWEDASKPQREVKPSTDRRQGGLYFSRFNLTLPRSANIKRLDPKTIAIKTNRLTFTIATDFEGFASPIPWEFKQYVLGLNPQYDTDDYTVSVRFTVSFRFASLFLPGGWDYYRWVESFAESFDDQFSEDRYFKNIFWEAAHTVIQYFECCRSKQSEN